MKAIIRLIAALAIGFLLPISTMAAADTTNVSPPQLQINFPGLQFSPIIKERGGSYLVPWIGDWVGAFYRYAVYAMTIIAAFMLTLAGLQYAASAGEPKAISKAKQRATNAVLALFLVYSSYIILYAINPSTVNLKGLSVLGVKDLGVGFSSDVEAEVTNTIKTNADIKGAINSYSVTINNTPVSLSDILTGPNDVRDKFLSSINPSYNNRPIDKDVIRKASEAARDYKVDPIAILTILAIESNFQSQDGKRGPCGEVGMTQIMPFNAERYAGQEGCCTKIWRKSGGTTKECGGNITTNKSDLKYCDNRCGTCAQATDACANAFNGDRGQTLSINSTAGLLKAIAKLGAVNGDLALTFMAYNGGPALRSQASAEYSRKAISIYQKISKEFGAEVAQ